MTNLLDEATATFNEILRMHKLNAELLENLVVANCYLKDYAEKYNIPLPNSPTFYSLINKAEALVEEITSKDSMSSFEASRRIFTDKKNRRRLYRIGL